MKIRCPICKEMTTWEENPNRPFCSGRCRLRDLGAWASGQYRVAGEKEDEGDEPPETKDD
ncbi:MAG: DNA gyrase inhibitor YacG [Nitrospirae bacterium]|nr:DNA gyrase inhibitor YacG [Nitrospirota bacterium]